ncbi:unnamed protein product [Schistocephalus solidus]|uniref:Cilia- and flagella-associated protein 126 n=1 Tax=Schistocephalus solidus TaxID=70667 RepID=A0A183T169_SCHSO|nr:unnamed protein product [Schistocephalus solidus]
MAVRPYLVFFRQHANHRTAPSRFIANDRGHLNERQDRHPGRNPFGNFVGNWDTPCHHPGNHVDNVINRSKPGIQYLQKQRELYNAAISANEAKNDRLTAEAVRNIAFLSTCLLFFLCIQPSYWGQF